uniref:Cannabinoid receptor interacting protein 1b n=1 Tax=Oryzias latipes TaxID=8090 RepID=A0A3P9MIG6_ORYLA
MHDRLPGLGFAGCRLDRITECKGAADTRAAFSGLSGKEKTRRSSGFDMADVPQLIKIGVSLKMLPNNTAVYFKSDGARFGQTRTIKLLTGSKYRIEVVIKPGAAEASSMTVGGVSFPLEQQSKDPQSALYTGLYDTEGVAHTKSGERQPVQISIQFTEAGLFETVWQVKYYNYNKRDHCQWGNSFNSIEYECKPNDTRTLMWINKETFV